MLALPSRAVAATRLLTSRLWPPPAQAADGPVIQLRLPSLASLRALVEQGRRIFHNAVDEIETVAGALMAELGRAQAWITDGVASSSPDGLSAAWLDKATTIAVDSLPHIRRLLSKRRSPLPHGESGTSAANGSAIGSPAAVGTAEVGHPTPKSGSPSTTGGVGLTSVVMLPVGDAAATAEVNSQHGAVPIAVEHAVTSVAVGAVPL